MSKVWVDRELLELAVKNDPSWPRLNKDHCCVGCGNWMPKSHTEAHPHEDDCEEEALALSRHWRVRLHALLAQPAEAEGVSVLDEMLALFPLKIDKQAFVVNGGDPLTADGDDEFLSFKKVNAALGEIRRLAERGRAALSAVTAERNRLLEGRVLDAETISTLEQELKQSRDAYQHIIDQTTPLEPVPGDPRWSKRIELDEVIAERDALRLDAERSRMRAKELDLMFGRYLLGMRSAVIEMEHGNGAEAGMQWIVNGLAGPGEFAPDDETDAQAYFDREIKAVNDGLAEVLDWHKAQRATMAAKEGV